MVLVARSMTGVLVMPMIGCMSPQGWKELGTAVAPAGSRLVFHSGAPAAGRVGVEGVDAVVLGGREDNVVRPPADGEVRQVQRLRVDLPVDRVGDPLAELATG